jgi:hypothetical protein
VNVLVRRFEGTTDWNKVDTLSNLYVHEKSFCLESQLCNADQFSFRSEALNQYEEEWTPACFACQAMATELEARSGLYSVLKDAAALTKDVCDQLHLPDEFDAACRSILSGNGLDEVSWLVKVHLDSVLKRQESDVFFPEYMCGEVKICPKREDQNKIVIVEIEAPYF